MRAAMAVDHVLKPAECGGYPRTDIVAKRYRSQEPGAVDPEFLAGRERRRHDGAAGMRLRRRMRVVGFVRVGEHPVGQRRFNRSAQHGRTGHSGHWVAPIRARELDREAAGRKFRAGEHRRECVEDEMLGLLDHGVWKRA